MSKVNPSAVLSFRKRFLVHTVAILELSSTADKRGLVYIENIWQQSILRIVMR